MCSQGSLDFQYDFIHKLQSAQRLSNYFHFCICSTLHLMTHFSFKERKVLHNLTNTDTAFRWHSREQSSLRSEEDSEVVAMTKASCLRSHSMCFITMLKVHTAITCSFKLALAQDMVHCQAELIQLSKFKKKKK